MMDWLFIPKISVGPIKFYSNSTDIHRLLGPPSKVNISEDKELPHFTDTYSDLNIRLMYKGTILDNSLVCIIVFPGDIVIKDNTGTVLFPSNYIDGILHMRFDEVKIGDAYPYQIQMISFDKGVAMVLNASEHKFDIFSAHTNIK